ncbi:MAG: tRNA (N6-isopentenyl adenosine(37)-C2)-methylthiotransferase MiaB [Alphaproteobacteria bacterium]|nr:tRNA (N6-isopentenyl adenosine(37)-C2)-methylthiotransferase MiaB [Alphaproteobacteria bacterium]
MTSTTQTGPERAARKRVHVKNWGCQMNVYDGNRMIDVLAPLGYAPADDAENADLVILNTCHIREKATDKLFSELGRLRAAQNARSGSDRELMIAVAGCVAQAEGPEIQRRAPYVQMVFGPQTYHQLPEMIARVERSRGNVLNTDFPAETKFDQLPAPGAQGPAAFLSVQEGCDKFCTFCVVPYTRGAEYSRPPKAVLAEARQLAARGAKEITLLGQNVNAYHGSDGAETWSLARLLHGIAEIPGVARLRYTTSHPLEMTDDLVQAHAQLPQLMPFLHLPVQSGADAVLAAMNRRHTREDYLRAVNRLRDASPGLALSSDFIVGFPGETDKDFEDTLDLVRQVGFAQAYSFAYSARPGTPAEAMPRQLPQAEKEARLHMLQALLQEQQKKFNEGFTGRTIPVLFDRRGKEPGQLLGRTPWMQAAHATVPDTMFGQIADVTVTGATLSSLACRAAEDKRAA